MKNVRLNKELERQVSVLMETMEEIAIYSGKGGRGVVDFTSRYNMDCKQNIKLVIKEELNYLINQAAYLRRKLIQKEKKFV